MVGFEELTPELFLHHGECLKMLPMIPAESVDAVITDPPYSSGGFTRGDRVMDAVEKYHHHGTIKQFVSFTGDNRDAVSWAYWCQLWLMECLRILKPGGYLLMFADWRQLGAAANAIQAAGFIHRGTIGWDKGNGARAPHKGYFRHQLEFVVWGTVGKLDPPRVDGFHRGPWPGCLRHVVKAKDKFHLTGKPVPLMRDLVICAPEGGTVLDPFAGSGSTGLASRFKGRRCLMIEQSEHYAQVIRDRVAADVGGVEYQGETFTETDDAAAE